MNNESPHDRTYLLNDPELSESERQEITRHVSGCQTCQARVHSWQGIGQGFKKIPAMAENPFFAQKVMAHIRGRAVPQKSSGWRVATYATVTAVLFAMVWMRPMENPETAALEEWALSDGQADPWMSDSESIDENALLGFALEEL